MSKFTDLLADLQTVLDKYSDTPSKPEKTIIPKGYLYEASNSPDHVGEWYVMPPAKLKRKIKSITVGSESYRYVRDWQGSELWYGKPSTGQMVVVMRNNDVIEPDDLTTSTKEMGDYIGKTNGGMPTFYFSRNMSQYPEKLFLTVKNVLPRTEIQNNGVRWDNGNVVLKQSEVSGRGMGLVVRSGKTQQAWIEF
jgi:hypothetical protein